MYREETFSKLGMLIIVIVVSALLVTGCGPKITSNEVVEKIRGLSDLTTTKYTMSIVVKSDTPGNWWAFGQDYKKMLLVAKGTVEAGVDLNQLQLTDVNVSDDGKNITVNLPPVMIRNRSNCLSNNPEDTYVYNASSGIFADTSNQQTELRGLANQELVKAACNAGIMKRANADAKAVVEKFLKTIMPTANITVNSGKEPSITDCIGQ